MGLFIKLSYHTWLDLRKMMHCNTWKIILVLRGPIAMIHVLYLLSLMN